MAELPGGQKRSLTLLFNDLCDSSRLAARVDEEVFADVLSSLRNVVRETVARHGGTIARVQGDGALAVFGFPEPLENSARHAAEAALDLRDAVRSLSTSRFMEAIESLDVHSGIHGGRVLVVDGDIERGRFDFVGEMPATASRLCRAAGAGEICVSETTLGPAAQFFVCGKPETLELEWRDEPIRIRKIIDRAPVERLYEASAHLGQAAFVGRDVAWSQLNSCWTRVCSGGSVCALIVGEPGMGKTRLVEEFGRFASPRGTVLRGFCESYLIAEPLQPFLQMLRAFLASRHAGKLPQRDGSDKQTRISDIDSMLAIALGSDAGASEGLPVEARIARWIMTLVEEGPVLLVLDDWQWADDASRRTLDQILALSAPIFVLVASRGAAAAAIGSGKFESIVLTPLDVASTGAVVNRWLPTLDPFLVHEIHAYAGGIPLFIEELCHVVQAGGRLEATRPGESSAWLSALVESRVARLPEGPAQLLRVAAALGNVFLVSLLKRVSGREDDDLILRMLADEDFLYASDQPGVLRFKHGITRDAVYATVGLTERKRLHGVVARILKEAADESSGEALSESLAYHLGASGAFDEAAKYAESAGDKAMSANALDRARAQYMAALRGLDSLPVLARQDTIRWCQIAQKLGMACVFDPISIPDRDQVLERAVALATQLDDANLLARAEYWLGYTRYAVGRAKSGLPHCERALGLALASGDARLAAQVRATLGEALVAVCRYDEAAPLLDAAIDTKRQGARASASAAIGSSYALACRGLLASDRAEFALSDRSFADARALLGNSAHPVASSVCGLMSIALLWQGRWSEATNIADEGARIAEDSRSRQLLAMGRAIAGYAGWKAHRDADAMGAIREAVQWIEVRGGQFMVSLLYGWLVDAFSDLDDEAQMRRHAARLLLRARDGDRIGEAMGSRALARFAAKRGRWAEAARWLERADRSAHHRHSPHELANNDLCRAQCAGLKGNGGAERDLLEAALMAYQRIDMQWHAGRVEQALVRAREHAESGL